MPNLRRTISTLAIAALIPLSGAAFGSAVATAAPSSSAVASLRCGYPPTHCTVLLNKSVYRPGQRVHFVTERHAFNSRGKVHVKIHGPHGYTHRFHNKHANPHGRLIAKIRLPKHHLPQGHYKLILKGHKHGNKVTYKAPFRVLH